MQLQVSAILPCVWTLVVAHDAHGAVIHIHVHVHVILLCLLSHTHSSDTACAEGHAGGLTEESKIWLHEFYQTVVHRPNGLRCARDRRPEAAKQENALAFCGRHVPQACCSGDSKKTRSFRGTSAARLLLTRKIQLMHTLLTCVAWHAIW